MTAPEGRRPIVFTLDDVFYADQLVLDEDGQPSAETGIGMIWHFAQEHPDFGFNLALFAYLGKGYNPTGIDETWEITLANLVVWCIDNGAAIFNHTFHHVKPWEISAEELGEELALHDQYLRELLSKVGRTDLIQDLGNMFAVPFGWPGTPAGYAVMQDYTTPEGKKMQAIFGVAYYQSSKPMPPPYADDFDPYNISRFQINQDALNHLVRNADEYPVAQVCQIGPLDPNSIDDVEYLKENIRNAIQQDNCPFGIYVINGYVFDAKTTAVEYIYP
jgi:peptidoglycan/xylan/chitin deacetylase (PgdA/CDA1 family)